MSQVIALPCGQYRQRFSVSLGFRRDTPRCVIKVLCPACRAPNTIEAPGLVEGPIDVTTDRNR